MKTRKINFLIILTFVLNVIGCSKDDPINQPPGAFTISPLVTENTVVLNWTEAIDPEKSAVTYSITLDNQIIATDLNNRIYEVKDLEYSKQFTGKIVAYDSDGLTSQGSFSFETLTRPNTAPTAPVLKSPAIGEGLVPLTPKLVWDSSSDAENDAIVYDVFLDKSLSPSVKVAENLTGNTYVVKTELDPESIYRWVVVAKDAFNAETFSATGKFKTESLVKAELVTDSPSFPDMTAHTSVVFNNKMWIIGGQSCCGGRYNDVYWSSNGKSWNKVSTTDVFNKRSVHASVVFKDKIWVTGGNYSYGSGAEFSDVFSSSDGKTWKEVTFNAEFGKRFGHKMIVFNDKMWILGGKDAGTGSYSQNQVWSSSDGVKWIKETDDAGISFRLSEFIVFENKIWRIGNYGDANIYSSKDGVKWDLESENAPFGQRHNHSLVEHDGKLWVISGSDKATNELKELSDVWYSEDGITWKLAALDAGYTAVAHHTSLVFDDKIWILAGGGGWQSSFVTNDVWKLEF